MIQSKEALQIMEKKNHKGEAIPFSIEFVTYDKAKKAGGDIIRLENVILAKNQRGTPRELNKTGSKTANHYTNATRNLYIKTSGQIRKCHIRLITEINGKTVIF
jgi:hypothetical protein